MHMKIFCSLCRFSLCGMVLADVWYIFVETLGVLSIVMTEEGDVAARHSPFFGSQTFTLGRKEFHKEWRME